MTISFSLADLAAVLPVSNLLYTSGGEKVTSITFRSSDVGAGSLFCAVKGTARDGHEFVDHAFAQGAVACLVSDPAPLKGRPGIIVSDDRSAVSALAAHWYGHPSRSLDLIGVTGTNGKTTTNWIIFNLLNLIGVKTLRMGTLGLCIPDVADEPDSLTSPDALTVHRDLARGVEAGMKAGVLEVASHALHQSRMKDVRLSSAVFTNLTRDHLDYHITMEEYGAAKLGILDLLDPAKGSMIINADDPFAGEFIRSAKARDIPPVTFAFDADADFRIRDLTHDGEGSRFHLNGGSGSHLVRSPYSGAHNAQNVTGALLSVISLGYSLNDLLTVLPAVPQVPGRLEAVGARGISVYVDYAHTPDALQNVLSAVRPLTTGRLWVVCGCGGDRDRGKRPVMGNIAVELADCAVFTSDNPRTEDPRQILDDMLLGGAKPEIVEVDRARAIEETLTRAKAGDTVVIAGKGHEDYQIIGTKKFPFSDARVVRDFFGL